MVSLVITRISEYRIKNIDVVFIYYTIRKGHQKGWQKQRLPTYLLLGRVTNNLRMVSLVITLACWIKDFDVVFIYNTIRKGLQECWQKSTSVAHAVKQTSLNSSEINLLFTKFPYKWRLMSISNIKRWKWLFLFFYCSQSGDGSL